MTTADQTAVQNAATNQAALMSKIDQMAAQKISTYQTHADSYRSKQQNSSSDVGSERN